MAKSTKKVSWPDEFKNFEAFVTWVKENIGEASDEVLRACYDEMYPE